MVNFRSVESGEQPLERSLADWKEATTSVDRSLAPHQYAEEVLNRLDAAGASENLSGTKFSASLRKAVLTGLRESRARDS